MPASQPSSLPGKLLATLIVSTVVVGGGFAALWHFGAEPQPTGDSGNASDFLVAHDGEKSTVPVTVATAPQVETRSSTIGVVATIRRAPVMPAPVAAESAEEIEQPDETPVAGEETVPVLAPPKNLPRVRAGRPQSSAAPVSRPGTAVRMLQTAGTAKGYATAVNVPAPLLPGKKSRTTQTVTGATSVPQTESASPTTPDAQPLGVSEVPATPAIAAPAIQQPVQAEPAHWNQPRPGIRMLFTVEEQRERALNGWGSFYVKKTAQP